jgi:hypothetical protein
LAEPLDDEFLGIEIHGIAWANLSYSSGMQHVHCGVEAEEVEPQAIWSATLDTIKEGAMAVLQQMLSEEMTMAVRDEALALQDNRLRPAVPFEWKFRHRISPEPLAPRDSDGGEIGKQGGSKSRRVDHGSCI